MNTTADGAPLRSPVDAVRQAATRAAILESDVGHQLMESWRALVGGDCTAAAAAARRAAEIIDSIDAIVAAAAAGIRSDSMTTASGSAFYGDA